jgi:alpha-ketoglutarate-dependent taurine dioxygenase
LKYNDILEVKKLFKRHPLLIFRNPNKKLSPSEFIDFLTLFDEDCDKEALKYPSKNPLQILQPFDQLPDCQHVSPRGNFYRNSLLGIKHINVKPGEKFISNYVWHTDLLGHPEKNPGVITGFHIIKNPIIGGDTDFISGETIFENLNEEQIKVWNNSRLIVNRENFAFGNKIMDYSGSYRVKDSDIKFPEGNVKIPIIFPPETIYQKSKVLIMPSFVEYIEGYNISETDKKLKYFMENFVLPYRFSIQWKEGDICVFNNRCFIHSSTPARNYLDLDLNERLIFQTFLPTKKKLIIPT